MCQKRTIDEANTHWSWNSGANDRRKDKRPKREQSANKIFFEDEICMYNPCSNKKRKQLGDFWGLKRGLTRCAREVAGAKPGAPALLGQFSPVLRQFRPPRRRGESSRSAQRLPRTSHGAGSTVAHVSNSARHGAPPTLTWATRPRATLEYSRTEEF